jgi:hypothetical protein
VWDTGALIDKADLTNPFLRMDSASNWYASYGQGAMEFYLNKNGTAAMFESNFNKYHNTTVAFDSDGNYYGGATNTDRISNTEATSYTFFNRGREVTAPATGAIMTGERTGAAWNWCITAEQEYTTLTGLKYPALPLPEQPIRPRCT